MRARIWMIVVVNFALMFFSEPARALGVECPDATIPGVYSVSERYENMDFGVKNHPKIHILVTLGHRINAWDCGIRTFHTQCPRWFREKHQRKIDDNNHPDSCAHSASPLPL